MLLFQLVQSKIELSSMGDCLACDTARTYVCRLTYSESTSFCCVYANETSSSGCDLNKPASFLCSSNLSTSYMQAMACPFKQSQCGA